MRTPLLRDVRRIRLRDLRPADADLVDAWNVDPERSEFNDFGEPPSPLSREALDTGVETSTDVENLAEQRSPETAGYVREGIQRGAQFRAGRYRDLVTYASLRADD
jgi:RimJ/RimL family protein N-acetyltransferase